MKMAPRQIPRSGGARRSRQSPARKVVQGKPPGSRRTDGSLEQQADVAADQAVRRLTNVSRGLTEAAPAKYDAPSSVGRELPAAVRVDLEETFGAELAAVRVHDDPAAHAAARREEAHAFTAGRDIYFAQGKYAPTGAEGRRLLSHEVAHVLQQTGRRISSTLIRATEREGTGELQRTAAEALPSLIAFALRYGVALSCLRPSVMPSAPDPDDRDEEKEPRHG